MWQRVTPMGYWRARAASAALGALRGSATLPTAHVVQPPLASFTTLAAASRCLERPIHHCPSLAAAAAVLYRAHGHHPEPVRADRSPHPTISLPWSAVACAVAHGWAERGRVSGELARDDARCLIPDDRPSERCCYLSAGGRIGFGGAPSQHEGIAEAIGYWHWAGSGPTRSGLRSPGTPRRPLWSHPPFRGAVQPGRSEQHMLPLEAGAC